VIARDRVTEKSVHEVSRQVDACGYAIISALLSPHEVENLLLDLQGADLPRSRAGVRHLLGLACVAQIANDPRLLGITQEILGPDAFPFRATLFDKAPDSNWLITWHQDTALPLTEKKEISDWGPWSIKQGVTYAHAPATHWNK
jgi:hypothetical protein